jgi:hypothetical protein
LCAATFNTMIETFGADPVIAGLKQDTRLDVPSLCRQRHLG